MIRRGGGGGGAAGEQYGTWQVVWLAWNALLVCLYLDVGLLDKDGDWLNLGTGAASWWEVNGAGCRPLFGVNATFVDPLADLLRPPRPDLVEGCLLDYTLVEVVHAGLQILLAVSSRRPDNIPTSSTYLYLFYLVLPNFT